LQAVVEEMNCTKQSLSFWEFRWLQIRHESRYHKRSLHISAPKATKFLCKRWWKLFQR